MGGIFSPPLQRVPSVSVSCLNPLLAQGVAYLRLSSSNTYPSSSAAVSFFRKFRPYATAQKQFLTTVRIFGLYDRGERPRQ